MSTQTAPLGGIHHVTAIARDPARNVDFYARVLGLRLVKKSVNQDDPTVYHLFYGDDEGAPGNDMTFFEYPGARQGKAGAGMVHTVGWRVASPEAVDFWESRLADEGIAGERYEDGRLAFRDPEGLRHILIPGESPDEPLIADHPEVPKEFALQGFNGVRAYAHDPEQSRRFLEETLEFEPHGEAGWETRGEHRGGLYFFDQSDEVGVAVGVGVHGEVFGGGAGRRDDHRGGVGVLVGVDADDDINEFCQHGHAFTPCQDGTCGSGPDRRSAGL
jgi:glyoxalase family protein